MNEWFSYRKNLSMKLQMLTILLQMLGMILSTYNYRNTFYKELKMAFRVCI